MQSFLLLHTYSMEAFAEQVSRYTASSFNLTSSVGAENLAYSVALHDAIMLYAHAATKVLSNGGHLHNGSAVTEALRSTSFEGVGADLVTLDKQGDRVE